MYLHLFYVVYLFPKSHFFQDYNLYCYCSFRESIIARFSKVCLCRLSWHLVTLMLVSPWSVSLGRREPPLPPDVCALQQVRRPVRRWRGDVPAGRRHLAPALRTRAARPRRPGRQRLRRARPRFRRPAGDTHTHNTCTGSTLPLTTTHTHTQPPTTHTTTQNHTCLSDT